MEGSEPGRRCPLHRPEVGLAGETQPGDAPLRRFTGRQETHWGAAAAAFAAPRARRKASHWGTGACRIQLDGSGLTGCLQPPPPRPTAAAPELGSAGSGREGTLAPDPDAAAFPPRRRRPRSSRRPAAVLAGRAPLLGKRAGGSSCAFGSGAAFMSLLVSATAFPIPGQPCFGAASRPS